MGQPVAQPMGQPTAQPMGQPIAQPMGQPGVQYVAQPVRQPKARHARGNSNAKLVVGAILGLAVIICLTIVICRSFFNKISGNGDTTSTVANAENQDEQFQTYDESADTSSTVDPELVAAFASTYEGSWSCVKYYVAEDKEWKAYKAGQQFFVVAWNFIEDVSDHTYLVDDYVEDDTHYYVYDTIDPVYFKYEAPTVTISSNYIDMSELKGPTFYTSDFRYENIDGYDYLINDEYKFAFMYDGKYLVYCEPDAYGYYQGYYAFTPGKYTIGRD